MIKNANIFYCKRKVGKTEVSLDFIVNKIMKSNDKLNICYFAPNKVMSIRVKSRLIEKLINKNIISSEKDLLVNNKNLLTLKDGTNIFFKVDTFDIQTAFRGFNFNYIILDEFSFFNQLRLVEIIENMQVMNVDGLLMMSTPDNKDMSYLEQLIKDRSVNFSRKEINSTEFLNLNKLFLSDAIKKILSF